MRNKLTQLTESFANTLHVNIAWFALIAGALGLVWTFKHRHWKHKSFAVRINWYMSVIVSLLAFVIGLIALVG
jgi:phosphatidylserine synthase